MENVAPQPLHRASRTRKPLSKFPSTEGKLPLHDSNHNGVQGRRRALGDITNRAGEQSSVFSSRNVKKSSTTSFKLDGNITVRDKAILNTSRTFQVPTDKYGEVQDPEIIPNPPSQVSYTPVLFEDGELEIARRRLEEQAAQEDDDRLDFMGRPYVRTEPKFRERVEMPYDPVEMMNEPDEQDLLSVTNLDLFNADQMISKDDYSTLELA